MQQNETHEKVVETVQKPILGHLVKKALDRAKKEGKEIPEWHMKILEHFQQRYSVSPLYDYAKQLTVMGLTPTMESIVYYDRDRKDWLIHPTYNLTALFVADLVVRYYTECNATFTIYGLRGSYKSITAIVIALINAFISGNPWKLDDRMVDTNSDLIDVLRKELVKFDTVILDEQDISRAGMGTQTLFHISIDMENRIRGRQVNICWCHPQKRAYHVSDYYLETYGAMRSARKIRLLLYDTNGKLMGALELPMPPDNVFEIYKKGAKKIALDRTMSLEDPVITRLKEVCEELKDDSEYPVYNKNREVRIMYIATKYPELRSENLRKRVEKLTRLDE